MSPQTTNQRTDKPSGLEKYLGGLAGRHIINTTKFFEIWRHEGFRGLLEQKIEVDRKESQKESNQGAGYTSITVAGHTLLYHYPFFHNAMDAAGAYFLGRTLFKERRHALIAATTIATASELSQRYDLLSGTYDPNDFVRFFIGATCAYGIDKVVPSTAVEHIGSIIVKPIKIMRAFVTQRYKDIRKK